MLNYLEFLLGEYTGLPESMLNARNIFIEDEDSAKLIVNLILETELKAYIIGLPGYPVERHPGLNRSLDVVLLDLKAQEFNDFIEHSELRSIHKTHFNPIWRLAAYFCAFHLKANEVYNTIST